MKLILKLSMCSLILGSALCSAVAKEIILEASKDTFFRSNLRNNNNGANGYLAIVDLPIARSIIAFDLSGVTNEILSAEFQFRQHSSVDTPVTLIVSPMVHTKNNASWKEGSGALGVHGQNARLGEATLSWRAFRDRPWESASGDPLQSVLESALWKTPIATRSNLEWLESTWVNIPLNDRSFLESIRVSDTRSVTFGLWGTAGNGMYLISSKESGNAPKLILTMKDENGK